MNSFSCVVFGFSVCIVRAPTDHLSFCSASSVLLIDLHLSTKLCVAFTERISELGICGS